MTWTINNKFKCDDCGKLASEPFDSETPYGCADPTDPVPYDPTEYCKTCAEKLYSYWQGRFKDGGRGGMWQKSNAEVRAAKEFGLTWVHSPSLVHVVTGHKVFNEYIVEAERDKYVEEYAVYKPIQKHVVEQFKNVLLEKVAAQPEITVEKLVEYIEWRAKIIN